MRERTLSLAVQGENGRRDDTVLRGWWFVSSWCLLFSWIPLQQHIWCRLDGFGDFSPAPSGLLMPPLSLSQTSKNRIGQRPHQQSRSCESALRLLKLQRHPGLESTGRTSTSLAPTGASLAVNHTVRGRALSTAAAGSEAPVYGLTIASHFDCDIVSLCFRHLHL